MQRKARLNIASERYEAYHECEAEAATQRCAELVGRLMCWVIQSYHRYRLLIRRVPDP